MKFKPPKILLWISVTLVVVVAAGWGFITYDGITFLRYGALHIKKFPESLRILDHETSGVSDFEAEYYCSITPTDLNQVLSGRKYSLTKCDNSDLSPISTLVESKSFPAVNCYTSGVLKNGLVRIFTNKDNTLIYIVYWVD